MPITLPEIFAALADPTRRATFERPARAGGQTVRVLTGTSAVSRPALSKHLAVLKRAVLVLDRRDGRQTQDFALPQGLTPLIDWMSFTELSGATGSIALKPR